jgi:competence protein ComEC
MLSLTREQDPYGVISSLLTHDLIQSSPEGLFRVLGFVHLYRASGIHLLVFFSLLDWIVQKIGMEVGISPKKYRWISFGLCSMSAFWIWSIQGFNVSFFRPLSTFYIRYFFKVRGAIARTLVPLMITCMIDGIIHHGNWFEGGLLHYYLAVMGGLLALERYRAKNYFIQHLAMAIGSWIPIAILDLTLDHLVSFMTPVYSLLTIPLISYFLYPISIVFLMVNQGLPDFWLKIWNIFIETLLYLPDLGLTFSLVSAQAVTMGMFLSGFTLVFLKHFKAWRHLLLASSFSLLILLFWFRAKNFNHSSLHRVIQLNVKQGDAALIQRSEVNELMDVGSARNVKSEEWIKKLAHYGVSDLHGILLTHLDEDHIGGLRRLLPIVSVGCIETSSKHLESKKGIQEREWIKRNFPELRVLSEGCIALSQVSWFQSHRSRAHGNDMMAGIMHEFNQNTAYFALGDGDMEQEQEFADRFRISILNHPKRIWKVGHHGSRYSSGSQFLQLMDPFEFWISVGKKNPYHHPNPQTMSRLSQFRGVIHRTDIEGDLGFSVAE